MGGRHDKELRHAFDKVQVCVTAAQAYKQEPEVCNKQPLATEPLPCLNDGLLNDTGCQSYGCLYVFCSAAALCQLLAVGVCRSQGTDAWSQLPMWDPPPTHQTCERPCDVGHHDTLPLTTLRVNRERSCTCWSTTMIAGCCTLAYPA